MSHRAKSTSFTTKPQGVFQPLKDITIIQEFWEIHTITVDFPEFLMGIPMVIQHVGGQGGRSVNPLHMGASTRLHYFPATLKLRSKELGPLPSSNELFVSHLWTWHTYPHTLCTSFSPRLHPSLHWRGSHSA